MACNCADEVDEKLASRNTALERGLVFGQPDNRNPHLILRTIQIETGRGKAKASAMFINFCPFCGTKYDPS